MDDNEEVHDDIYDSYNIADVYEARLAQSRIETQRLIAETIRRLPVLRKDELPLDDNCPICFQGFGSITDGDAQNEETLKLENGEEVHLNGVTKLEGCGHIFCRLE